MIGDVSGVGQVILASSLGTIVVVVGALFKFSRQFGRIEEGVKGLYGRMERLEKKQDDDDRDARRRR